MGRSKYSAWNVEQLGSYGPLRVEIGNMGVDLPLTDERGTPHEDERRSERPASHLGPPGMSQSRAERQKQTKIGNWFRDSDDDAKVYVKQNHVIVNGRKISEELKRPKVDEIFNITQDDAVELLKIRYKCTNIDEQEFGSFQLYETQITTIEEANKALKGILLLPDVLESAMCTFAY